MSFAYSWAAKIPSFIAVTDYSKAMTSASITVTVTDSIAKGAAGSSVARWRIVAEGDTGVPVRVAA